MPSVIPTYADDFQEVAHAGGRITFTVVTDDGRRQYQIGFSGSSPNPMSICAVYALSDGTVVDDVEMGGMGQSWGSPPIPGCLPVLIASDSEGKFGHQCFACSGYWRSRGAPATWDTICPYCGVRGKTSHFLTDAQREYVNHYVNVLCSALEADEENLEVTIDMDAVAADATIDKPSFYYAGEKQQTQFNCSKCGEINDIRGRFGNCSSCGWRNNFTAVSKAYEELRDSINTAQIGLDEAVKKAASTFDASARDYLKQVADRVPMTSRRREEIEGRLLHSPQAFLDVKNWLDIDVLSGFRAGEKSLLSRMFSRRHAHEHDGGVVTERYLKNSGDETVSLGQLIREDREGVHSFISMLQRMSRNLDLAFHEIFPPQDKPIDIHNRAEEFRKST